MRRSIIILIVTSLFVACESSDTANVSRTTFYPTFTYNPTVAIPLGGTFNETVIVTENDIVIPHVVGGEEVNTNEVGIYFVTYSATNIDGISANVTQTVVVHDPSIVGTDVSGNIRDKTRNERTAVISLVEGTTSIFFSTDFAYAGAFPMYFQMDGNTISEIPQTYPLGVESVDLSYDPGTKTFTTLVHPDEFEYTFEYY